MSAGLLDLIIEQGATYQKNIQWQDAKNPSASISGFIVYMEVKSSTLSDTVLLPLSTTNGRITVSPTNNTITLYLSATETSIIDWTYAVYDLYIKSPLGVAVKILQGSIRTVPSVTKWWL